MLDTRFFEFVPETGTTRLFHFDDETGIAQIEAIQDVEPLIDQNKRDYNSVDERARHSDLNRYASIPMNIYYDLKRRGILDDQLAMKRWLNDHENRHFRTRPGRV